MKHGATFCSFPCLQGPLGTVGLFSLSGWLPCVFPMGRAASVVVTLEFITRWLWQLQEINSRSRWASRDQKSHFSMNILSNWMRAKTKEGRKKCWRLGTACGQNCLNTRVSLFWWLQRGGHLQSCTWITWYALCFIVLFLMELLQEAFHPATPKHGYPSGLGVPSARWCDPVTWFNRDVCFSFKSTVVKMFSLLLWSWGSDWTPFSFPLPHPNLPICKSCCSALKCLGCIKSYMLKGGIWQYIEDRRTGEGCGSDGHLRY